MEWILPAMAAALGAVIATVLARSRARRDAAEGRAQAAEALVEKADAKLRDTFQSLAADALKDNRAAFLDLAKTSFAGFQQPIADTLKKVDQRLSEAERDRVAAYARLTEQVAALGSTTNTLSRALRTPAVRGRWGEMQLRRVVETRRHGAALRLRRAANPDRRQRPPAA